MGLNIRFITFSQFHGKRPPTGSTHIRVNQLTKYWDEADLYKYGENPDVLIFQKVYCTQDYKFPYEFEGIKILDICDPDWKDFCNVAETVDAVDAIVTPTENLAKFIRQFTDKPVRVINDRFDLEQVPKLKQHKRRAEEVVWYGYSHNAEGMKEAMATIEKLGFRVKVISNDDPSLWKWTENMEEFRKTRYKFVKYNEDTIYEELQKSDICVLPKMNRFVDQFKSENKTIKAQLAGLPVVTNGDELREMIDPVKRQKHVKEAYDKIKEEYDVHKSIEEYKELINDLIRIKT